MTSLAIPRHIGGRIVLLFEENMVVPVPQTQAIRPDVSIVIATLDRDDFLESTLRQIAAQSLLPGLCVVVDQGKRANKNRFFESLRAKGVRCTHVYSAYRSISAARNIGLALSDPAKIVIYIDDDVELGTDLVQTHVGYYDEEPDTVAVAGHITCGPGPSDFERLNTFRPAGRHVPYGRGCHMSFRTRILHELGGFNAYICNNGDEAELYRRLVKAGYAIRNGEEAVLKHLLSPAGGNRQVGLKSHANYGRVLRDGMVRASKDRGALAAAAWPMKNWRTLVGIFRTASNPLAGVHAVIRDCRAAFRLARLSAARRNYIPLSLTLASGTGVDPRSGLPTV